MPHAPKLAPQWEEVEFLFESDVDHANPYTDASCQVLFEGPSGEIIVRHAFWDGGRAWRVRFASMVASGSWKWSTTASRRSDRGLHGLTGHIEARPPSAPPGSLRHRGLLRISPGRRNIVTADGSPLLLVADTAWALPWRATLADAATYAADRASKGFNAALLMTVQPDRRAEGPDDRTAHLGFARAFTDLPDGRLERLQPAYFQDLDRIVDTLLDHGIIPIHCGLFHGYGWKGLDVIGQHASPADSARFWRYLVARYGARPALWLVGADGTGREASTEAAGREVHAVDDYAQPTGIHYNPWQANDAFWRDRWCDFHLCQTGHGGEHRPEKVAVMHARTPPRAVANGEPTYEGMGGGRNGLGWWQGHEAWINLLSGGTLGVFYGAASLWQWKLDASEPGWPDWCCAPFGWREALALEGSRFPGHVGRALSGLPFTDAEPRIDLARGRLCLAVPERCAVIYLHDGGGTHVDGSFRGLPFRWFDPRTGSWLATGTFDCRQDEPARWLDAPPAHPPAPPLVLVIGTSSVPTPLDTPATPTPLPPAATAKPKPARARRRSPR